MNIDAFDRARIEEARRLLYKVYEYNYGDPSAKKEVSRLDTIIRKIDQLLNKEDTP